MARETEPDVVLMDINMPDMDGIAATEALKQDVRFAQIIILSVQSEADYLRRAMRAGASDFIAALQNSSYSRLRLSTRLW